MAKNQIGKSWSHSGTNLPTVQPSNIDIAWAAGIFEGEGSTFYHGGTNAVTVPQADPWILEKLSSLFGGNIRIRGSEGRLTKRDIYVWNIYGLKARNFLDFIYSFMSPRRKSQIDKCLNKGISN